MTEQQESRWAVVITALDDMSKVNMDDNADGKDTLTKLQGLVGGLIEAIDLTDNITMWINEEGLFSNMTVNKTASDLYDKVLQLHLNYNPSIGNIVGDVVFTGGIDEEGNFTTLQREDELYIEKAWSKYK